MLSRVSKTQKTNDPHSPAPRPLRAGSFFRPARCGHFVPRCRPVLYGCPACRRVPYLRCRGRSSPPQLAAIVRMRGFPVSTIPRHPRLPVLRRIATQARRMREHSPNKRRFSDPRPGRAGIYFASSDRAAPDFPAQRALLSAPNQVGIWIFAVKGNCFSKPHVTGIVRFVRAKQRVKTPTQFRAGVSCRHFREFRLTFVQLPQIIRFVFVQFAKLFGSALCGSRKNSDLLSCSAALHRHAAQQPGQEKNRINSDVFSCRLICGNYRHNSVTF